VELIPARRCRRRKPRLGKRSNSTTVFHYCYSWLNRTPLSTFSMPTRAIAPSSRRWAGHRCTEKAIWRGDCSLRSSNFPGDDRSVTWINVSLQCRLLVFVTASERSLLQARTSSSFRALQVL
jgi:hypothetical protein